MKNLMTLKAFWAACMALFLNLCITASVQAASILPADWELNLATNMEDTADEVFTTVLPIFMYIFTLVLGFRLLKRFLSKST